MKKKLLLIDDDQEMCREMKEILNDMDYCVDTVHDGHSAVDRAKNNEYNILLLDLKIPGLNGLDVLKKVKERSKMTKVMVLTGRPLLKQPFGEDAKSIEDETIMKLADAVISKPFDIEKVLDKIENLLPR